MGVDDWDVPALGSMTTVRDARWERYLSQAAARESKKAPGSTRPGSARPVAASLSKLPKEPNLSDNLANVLKRHGIPAKQPHAVPQASQHTGTAGVAAAGTPTWPGVVVPQGGRAASSTLMTRTALTGSVFTTSGPATTSPAAATRLSTALNTNVGSAGPQVSSSLVFGAPYPSASRGGTDGSAEPASPSSQPTMQRQQYPLQRQESPLQRPMSAAPMQAVQQLQRPMSAMPAQASGRPMSAVAPLPPQTVEKQGAPVSAAAEPARPQPVQETLKPSAAPRLCPPTSPVMQAPRPASAMQAPALVQRPASAAASLLYRPSDAIIAPASAPNHPASAALAAGNPPAASASNQRTKPARGGSSSSRPASARPPSVEHSRVLPQWSIGHTPAEDLLQVDEPHMVPHGLSSNAAYRQALARKAAAPPGLQGQLQGAVRTNKMAMDSLNSSLARPASAGSLRSHSSMGSSSALGLPGGLDMQGLLTTPPGVIDTEVADHDASVTMAIEEARQSHSLEMRGQGLKQLPQQLLRFARSEGRNMTSLVLSHNALIACPPLELVPSLTRLDLSFNQLVEVPSTLGNLTGLQHLQLRNNRLTALPDMLSRLTGLNDLDVQCNQIKQLPPHLDTLSRITTLALDNNQLHALPASIGGLSSLAQLSVAHNQLTGLPPGISQLLRLRSLSLHHNMLSAIPLGIGELLSCLTELQLHANHLSVLPREVAFLTSLSTLSLHDNPLMHPPSSVAEAGPLKVRLFLMNTCMGLGAGPAPSTGPLSSSTGPATVSDINSLGPSGSTTPASIQSSGPSTVQSDPGQGQQAPSPATLALAQAEAQAAIQAEKVARGIDARGAPLIGAGARAGCSGCRDLGMELEEQGALLLRAQLEREAFEAQNLAMKSTLASKELEMTALDREARDLTRRLADTESELHITRQLARRGARIATPDAQGSAGSTGSASAGTAASEMRLDERVRIAPELLEPNVMEGLEDMARMVRRLHNELREARGEQAMAEQRAAEALAQAELERVRAAQAAAVAGAAKRAAEKCVQLEAELVSAAKREDQLQELVAHHLFQQRSAEDRCLEAEAKLDSAQLGSLGAWKEEVVHLRIEMVRQRDEAAADADKARGREAALEAEVARLSVAVAALEAERDTLQEVHAAAGKVFSAAEAAELAELAQAGMLLQAHSAPWPAWPLKPAKLT